MQLICIDNRGTRIARRFDQRYVRLQEMEVRKRLGFIRGFVSRRPKKLNGDDHSNAVVMSFCLKEE